MYNGEKTFSLISDSEKCGQLDEKNKITTLFGTIHRNKLKIGQIPEFKTRHYKTLREKHRQNTLWHKSQEDPLWPTSQNIGKKSKNKKVGPN